MRYLSVVFMCLSLFSCGGTELTNLCNSQGCDIPGYGSKDDSSNVRGIAIVQVQSEQESAMNKIFNFFNMQSAFASTATATVIYNNAPSVIFTVNVANLVPGSFSGLNLNLGSFNITALKDNDIEVCGVLSDTQCVNAYLRVYTTGSVAGFVDTTHTPQYGAPVFTSGINPAVPVPLNSPGIDIKNVLAMAPTKHVVNLVDFVTTSYTVKSDFSNAGYGSYSMTYVIEYALSL